MMKEFLDSLKNFPNKIFTPAFHDISIPVLNQLIALKTFPLGNIRNAIGKSKLDGIFFDEKGFPIHDWGHAIGIKEDPSAGTLTDKIVDPLETQSLRQVTRQKEKRWETWNVFHFLLFHEGIRHDYIDLNLNGLKLHYRDSLKSDIEGVFRKNAETEIFADWFFLLTKKEQKDYLQVESELYIQMLDAQIDSNADLIQTELDMIKSASGN